MTCRNATETPLFSLLLAARSRNHVEFHGWSAKSPRDRPGQRELCSLKTAPWGAGMNAGWKNSKQAINYRRRESSPALGSFRNMMHTVSGCWGRRGFLVTHTKKKPLLGFQSWTRPKDSLGNGSPSLQEEHKVQILHLPHGPFSVPTRLELGYVGISSL